jgi:transcriptional regulator with XRE-family HTH domain
MGGICLGGGRWGVEIGKKIRKLRVQAGLTQEELANRADLTKGFISQMENDATSPSIATLEDIVAALGTNLADFFKGSPGTEKKVVFGREDWVVSGESEGGFELTFLIPQAHGNEMEPVLVTLGPGGATEATSGHEGEEFGYLLCGQVELHLGTLRHVIRKGECFYYGADVEHRIVNRGRREARILWVSCPPMF